MEVEFIESFPGINDDEGFQAVDKNHDGSEASPRADKEALSLSGGSGGVRDVRRNTNTRLHFSARREQRSPAWRRRSSRASAAWRSPSPPFPRISTSN